MRADRGGGVLSADAASFIERVSHKVSVNQLGRGLGSSDTGGAGRRSAATRI